MRHNVDKSIASKVVRDLILRDARGENTSLHEESQLLESGLLFRPKGAISRTTQGQVIVLAGGSGSGKGLVKEHLILLGFKDFDVDELKKKVLKAPSSSEQSNSLRDKFYRFLHKVVSEKTIEDVFALEQPEFAQLFRDYLNDFLPEVEAKLPTDELLRGFASKNRKVAVEFLKWFKEHYSSIIVSKELSLKDYYVVNRLREFEHDNDLSGKEKESFYNSLQSNKSKFALPNIVFDKTMKKEKDLVEVVNEVIPLGYSSENIHVVWVLAPLDEALKNNSGRDRQVSPNIVAATHEGVAHNMFNLIVNNPSRVRQIGMDGEFWVVFNSRGNKDMKVMKNTIKGEEKIVAIDKYKRKLIKNRNQDISIDDETLETIKRYTSFFE